LNSGHSLPYLHVKKRESQEFVVAAYLLRVRKAAFRPEAHRNPTWFPPRKLKSGLPNTARANIATN